MEEATKERPPPDIKSMAPMKTGGANDMKALLEQLQQASVSTPSDYQALGLELDQEVPMNAIDELRGITGKLLKLDQQGESQVEKPVAGKRSLQKRVTHWTADQKASVPSAEDNTWNEDNKDKAHEDDLKDTMRLIVKANNR